MFKVVNEQKGTAFKSKSNQLKFSGKTGTSQVKKITLEERESEDFRKKELSWKNKDHALFVGYMPSDKPKYAYQSLLSMEDQELLWQLLLQKIYLIFYTA